MTIHIDRYDELPASPYRLGRHREHDDRSLHFVTPWDQPNFSSVAWSTKAPVIDQGDIGSCTGNTMVDLLNTDMFTPVRKRFKGGKYLNEGDALNLYSKSTFISAVGGGDRWPPTDTGSSGIAVSEAAKDFGYIDHYLHCFTWHQFQATIEQQPVMLGTVWTNDMFNYDGSGVITLGSLDDSNISGGHEYMARGIFYDQQLVLCRNHWYDVDDKGNAIPWNPQTVGEKLPGEFFITFNDLQALLGAQGDVTMPHGVGLP